MIEHVLITGGAGFIGSHLADELLRHGCRVRALDNLSPQVHGDAPQRPSYLASEVELITGDVRDREVVRQALRGVDAVYHFAAAVGVGQSMYQLERYVDVNERGTAVLLETIAEQPVQRMVVASSMSIYGEGCYCRPDGRPAEATERTREQLARGNWEPPGLDGEAIVPVPTPESKRPALASVYAMSKYGQERMALMIGEAYNIPTVALRFFNVYGPRQALSNPYTGVLAIFAARLLNDKPPTIFEDGEQKRDLVNVRDVARACRLALSSDDAVGQPINIGSGTAYSVREIASRVAAVLGKRYIAPEITGKYRVGDIRHCFADISRARAVLGYEPEVSLEEGFADLATWLTGESAEDRVAQAQAELVARGLTV